MNNYIPWRVAPGWLATYLLYSAPSSPDYSPCTLVYNRQEWDIILSLIDSTLYLCPAIIIHGVWSWSTFWRELTMNSYWVDPVIRLCSVLITTKWAPPKSKSYLYGTEKYIAIISDLGKRNCSPGTSFADPGHIESVHERDSAFTTTLCPIVAGRAEYHEKWIIHTLERFGPTWWYFGQFQGLQLQPCRGY